MTRINVHEAKTHLSKVLDRVEKGETVILCRRNLPIAEIRPLAKEAEKPYRRFGFLKGLVHVTDAFFEPMPDDFMEHFGGQDDEIPDRYRLASMAGERGKPGSAKGKGGVTRTGKRRVA
jgi:prevent-host-death family protein